MTARALGLVALVVTAVLVLIPTSVGGATVASASLSPPFKHTLLRYSNASSASGCSSVSVPLSPYLHRVSGRLAGSVAASSPACAGRIGVLGASSGAGLINMRAEIAFKASTGMHSVILNASLSWTENWNLTIPTCVNHASSPSFRCIVKEANSVRGWSFLSRLSGASVPHLSSNGTWTQNQNRVALWEFTCLLPSNSSCSTKTHGQLNGTVTRTFSGAVTFSGFLNSTYSYVVGIGIELIADSYSDHTAGGSMTGGTAFSQTSIVGMFTSVTVT